VKICYDKKMKKKTVSRKKLFWWCCCGPIILIVLLAVAGIAYIYYSGFDLEKYVGFKKEGGNFNRKADSSANLAPAFFLKSTPPNYSIDRIEEAKFNRALARSFSKDDLKNVKNMIAGLKKDYPEGYFVIVKISLKQPKQLKILYNSIRGSGLEDVGTIIHEMTHLGTYLDCTYFVEDKCIKIKNYDALSEQLFTGDKLLKYISEKNFVDEEYLEKDRQKILLNLDEVNAYIKSVRTDRVYQEHNTNPATLARQLYYITLHLKHAKEERLETWDALVANKGFAYVLMRLTVMAEAELETAREEGFSGGNVDDNLKLYQDNREYLDRFLSSAGVEKLRDLNLTYVELRQRGIDFSLEKL